MIDKAVLSHHIDIMVETQGIAIVPDVIEKRVYGRIVKMLFDVLDKMSGRTLFKIMGHEIAFFVKPEHVAVQMPV